MRSVVANSWVTAEGRRGFRCRCDFRGGCLRFRGRGVVEDDEILRRRHRERERRFEVRLVEVGEYAPSVRGFVLCVQVDLVISRVDEAVHAFTAC